MCIVVELSLHHNTQLLIFINLCDVYLKECCEMYSGFHIPSIYFFFQCLSNIVEI